MVGRTGGGPQAHAGSSGAALLLGQDRGAPHFQEVQNIAEAIPGAIAEADVPMKEGDEEEKVTHLVTLTRFVGQGLAAAAGDLAEGRFHHIGTPPHLEGDDRRVEAANTAWAGT